MDVSKVDGAVAQVVHSSSGRSDGGRRNGLLGEGVRDQIAVSRVEDVRISRRNPQELGGVLLLRLGHVGAAVLTIKDPLRSLPLGFLGQLGHGFHRVTNGQEVDESNSLLLDDLYGIDGTELAQLLPQLILTHFLGQVTKVDVARCARLLYCECHGCRNLRRLPPADLDVISLDRKFLQDRVGVEVGGRVAVEEGNEGTVLIREKANRLDLSAADVVENFFSGRFGGYVTQVHGSARSRQKARGDRCRGTTKGGISQTSHTSVNGRLWTIHILLVTNAVGRHHSRV